MVKSYSECIDSSPKVAGLRIVVMDDVPLYRSGLTELLRQVSGVAEAVEFTHTQSASRTIATYRPDALMIDLHLPLMKSLDMIRHVQINAPSTRVVALTDRSTGVLVAKALKLKVDGMVIKTSPFKEVLHALFAVVRGRRYLSPELGSCFAELSRMQSSNSDSRIMAVLTAREREVVLRLVEGQSCRDIAKDLYLSVKTVDAHRYQALRKLGLRNVPDLTRLAVAEGLSRP